jgi:hypothetical protein
LANGFTRKLLFLIFVVVGVAAAQSAPPRKDIPTIAKAANGAIVSIVMSDKDGKALAQGTGFLISKDGRIVTNYHVIAEGNSAVVKLPNGAFYVVDGVLAFDKTRDVAVIKAHGEDFRTLTLGNSDRIRIGEEVVAIGNPLSLESTVSNGIISGIRTVEKRGGKFLQTTAPISPGSSGGPLFNMAGEVIGINTLYLEGGENLNFAIPANDARSLLLKSSELQVLPNERSQDAKEDTPVSPHNKKDQITIFVWANTLAKACSNYNVQAGESLTFVEIAEKAINKGHCEGLILGFGEYYTKTYGVCWPPHSDPGDVINGVKAILERSPVLRDNQLPASAAVGIALKELYPCSEK